MNHDLKVRQLIFADDTPGLIVEVQCFSEKKMLHYSAQELFHNDKLLANFGIKDIRLIISFAVIEEFAADQAFLRDQVMSNRL